MESLLSAMHNLSSINPNIQFNKVSACAAYVCMRRPISVKAMIEKINNIQQWIRLNFAIQHQQQTEWCWAAVTASVSAFFNPNTIWTQCAIVNAEFGRTDCCASGSSAYCNKPWYLDRPLTRTGNFQSSLNRAGTFCEIENEIDVGRPLCAQIQWSGGGDHAVVLGGYNQVLDMVTVDDPWYGVSDVVFATFLNNYQGTGSWVQTFWVHA